MIRLANFEKHLSDVVPVETLKYYFDHRLPETLAAELRLHREVQYFTLDGDAPTGDEACDLAADDAHKMITRACREGIGDCLVRPLCSFGRSREDRMNIS